MLAGSSVWDKVSDANAQVKKRVSDLGRTVADKIDENRAGTATRLEKAAETLHEKAESLPGREKVASLAHSTANKLNSTANYVRTHDVNRMVMDIGTLVKNNPGPSLIAAAVLGFLVARAVRSND